MASKKSYFPVIWSDEDNSYIYITGHKKEPSEFTKGVLYWTFCLDVGIYAAIDDDGELVEFEFPLFGWKKSIATTIREMELGGIPFHEILRALQI